MPTVVGPEQVLVMEQEVNTLLEKGAMEYVPPSNRETGFYSRYFIVPKKDGGLRSILDLRVLYESAMQLKFKILTLRQIVPQIRSEDWFVTIDLKDAYFHPSVSLEVPERTTFLGVVWDSVSMQARLSSPRFDSILAAVKSVKLGQLLTVKQFQRLLDLMAAASNGIPFGLLHMRPLQWWLRTRWFFPEGQPISHNQGHAVMPTCLGYVEETLVPVPGPSVGSSLSSQTANDGCFPHGLGSDPEGRSSQAYIPGVQNIGADTLSRQGPRPGEWWLHPRGGGADMEIISGSVCVSRDVSLSTLVLLHASSSSETGCYGTDVAEATSVRLSPSCSAPGSSGKSSQGPGLPAFYSPALAGQSMVSRSCVPPRRASSGATRQEGPSVPSRGLNISPPPRAVEPVGLASEGAQLIESVNCPIGTVLEFLQDRFTAGLTPSTLKVYVAAVGAYHSPLGGMSVGKDPLKGGKGSVSRAVDRLRKKFEECEIWLLTNTPSFTLDLHSTSGKSHTVRLFSLCDLNEWKEAIEKQSGNCIETVPPDLLSVTGSCIKLRMTQQPPLHCVRSNESTHICGSLYVMVQSACGLQHPSSAYVCVEVDGFEFYDRRKQTSLSTFCVTPQWDEELVFQVDGAQRLFLVFVSQCENDTQDDIVGRAVLNLDPDNMFKKWKKVTCSLGQVDVTLSIKYVPHPLEPPSTTPLVQEPVFCVPIGQVAMQESVLVPHIVRSCVEEVERRGMTEEGIYRISGASSEIQALKYAFNTNYREAVSKLRSIDVNAVTGTLKLYFRELPLTLIPSEQFKELSDALDIADPYLRADSMLTLLQALPDVNRNTLLFLLHHLRRVAERKEENKMSLSNLATVFGPSLLRPPVARVDISQEVEVQVQVIFLYLQCQNLPEALLTKHLDIDELET
ncbi:unnamed protein product [Leuciscus chuanchicus]